MSDGGFDPAWLDLREPADARARDDGLARQLHRSKPATWRVVDLGCGTGANGRWLAPKLGGWQDWRLIDGDARLLAQAAMSFGTWAGRQGFTARRARNGAVSVGGPLFEASFRPQRLDLRADLRRTLAGANLVTASALLDLVAEDWLAALVAACRLRNAACLFALTYDGTMGWTPADPDDDAIVGWFNAHQRRAKGFGPALGPTAGDRAIALLQHAGYRVSVAATPWRLAASDGGLQRTLLDGIAAAGREQEPAACADIGGWLKRRGDWVAKGMATMTVGHVDILALPAGKPVRT